MQKKRSKGVKLLGIFIAIMGLLRLFSVLMLFNVSLSLLSPNELSWQNVSNAISFTVQELQRQRGITVFQLSASQILNLGFFISGIGILLLKDWARWLLLGVSIISAFLIIFGLFLRGIKIGTLSNIYFLALYILFIYCFTRLKVKETFK